MNQSILKFSPAFQKCNHAWNWTEDWDCMNKTQSGSSRTGHPTHRRHNGDFQEVSFGEGRMISEISHGNVFRHHDPFHGTWRESFYQAPAPGKGVRRYLKDRPAPQPPAAKEARSRRHPEDGYMKASDRAYKAFNQASRIRNLKNSN